MAEMFDASSFKFDDENEQTFDASSFKFDEEPSSPAHKGATDVDGFVAMHQNKDEAPVNEGGTVGFEYNGKKANVGDYVAIQGRDGKTSLKKVNDPVDGVAVLEDTDDEPEEGKTYPTLTADEWDEGRKNKKIRRNVSPAEYRRLQHEAETGSEVFGEKSGKTASFLADTIPFGGRMMVDEERGKIARMEKFVKGEPELRGTKDSGQVFISPWGSYSPQVKVNGDEAWEIEAKSLGVDASSAKRGKDEDSESYKKRLRGLVLEKMKETVSRQDKAKQELEYIESDWKDMVFGSGRQSIGYGLEYAATAPIGGALVKGGAALLKAAPKVAKAVGALSKAAPKTAKVLAGTAKVVTEAQPMALVEAESNYEKFRENGYTMKNGALEIESRADNPETALVKAIKMGEASAVVEAGTGNALAPVYRAIGKAIGKNAVGQAVVKVAKAYGKIRDTTKFGDIAFEELPEENIQFFFSDVLGWGKKDSEYNGFLNELNAAFSDGGQYTLKGQWNTALGMLLQMGGQAALAGGATAVEVSANSRKLANLLEGSGMSKEQVANLSYGQRVALARLHNKFANNRGKLEHALKLFGGYLGQHANEIVKQTTFRLQNNIAKYGEKPHQFEIQSEVGVDGKPKPVLKESLHTDGITGKQSVRKEMFDPKAGVSIVENEDGSYEIYDEIHPERSFATDNFDEALRCANLYSLSNQKLNLDNRLKEEYVKNLLSTKYKNTNFKGYDTVGNLYHAAVNAINKTGSFHGYQLNQIFKTDSKGEVILPPQTVEGGVKGLAGKDGTIVAVLDNIKTAKDMNAMFSHETKHLKATKDMLMRISPKSECWKYVEMIRKAYAEKGIEASELKIREEGFAYWAQQRGHNPSLMQRVSHAFTTKNGELNDADLEVIAYRMEREGEVAEENGNTPADFIRSTDTMSDSQALESEETQEEVGNETRANETQPQPEQAPRVTPPAGEEARPVEAGKTPPEVGGEVEANTFRGHEVPNSATDAQKHTLEAVFSDGKIVNISVDDKGQMRVKTAQTVNGKEFYRDDILGKDGNIIDDTQSTDETASSEKVGGEVAATQPIVEAPTSASTETKANTPPTTTESAERNFDVADAAESEKKPVAERSVIEKMTEQAPVEELPVAEVFNDDTRIPNFKEGANPETGEVEPLTGEPYDLVSNPIVVMEFKDGKKVVVTGRHRLALYKRSGRKTIAARVIKESDGWTVDDAKMIDSIGNIIDEKGSVKDYVKYFEDAKPSRESAESGGFLSRPKGRLAYSIYEGASADTRAAIDFEGGGADGQISVEQAGIIAEAAPVKAHPRNKALQRILVNKALAGLRGKKLGILARSLAEEVKNAKDAPNVGGEMQLDLFTSQEDLNLLAMEEKRADYRTKKSQEYNRIAEVLRTAISKGGKLDLNKEYAEELGITDPKDKKQLAAARDKAVEKANYWETAIRLEDADKTAMDNEITAKADATAKKAADAKAKAEAKLAEIKAKREGKTAPKAETPKAPDPKEAAYQEWLNKAKFSDTPARRAEWERKQELKDANKKTARTAEKAPEKADSAAQRAEKSAHLEQNSQNSAKEPSIKMKDEAAEKRAQKGEIRFMSTEIGNALEDTTSESHAKETEKEPRKVRKAFKLFRKYPDGTYGALFIDSANRLRIGEWYEAKSPLIAGLKQLEGLPRSNKLKWGKVYLVDDNGVATAVDGMPNVSEVNAATQENKRYMTVTFGSKGQKLFYNLGINGSGSVAGFAYRPGWHSTNAPSAAHIGPSYGMRESVVATGQNHYRPSDQVWCEIEIPDTIDYNKEALNRAPFLKEKGRENEKNRKEAQLDHIPLNGSYFYRTNSNADEKQDWIISGAVKIVRELSREEVNRFNHENGFRPDAPIADSKAEALNKRTADPADYANFMSDELSKAAGMRDLPRSYHAKWKENKLISQVEHDRHKREKYEFMLSKPLKTHFEGVTGVTPLELEVRRVESEATMQTEYTRNLNNFMEAYEGTAKIGDNLVRDENIHDKGLLADDIKPIGDKLFLELGSGLGHDAVRIIARYYWKAATVNKLRKMDGFDKFVNTIGRLPVNFLKSVVSKSEKNREIVNIEHIAGVREFVNTLREKQKADEKESHKPGRARKLPTYAVLPEEAVSCGDYRALRGFNNALWRDTVADIKRRGDAAIKDIVEYLEQGDLFDKAEVRDVYEYALAKYGCHGQYWRQGWKAAESFVRRHLTSEKIEELKARLHPYGNVVIFYPTKQGGSNGIPEAIARTLASSLSRRYANTMPIIVSSQSSRYGLAAAERVDRVVTVEKLDRNDLRMIVGKVPVIVDDVLGLGGTIASCAYEVMRTIHTVDNVKPQVLVLGHDPKYGTRLTSKTPLTTIGINGIISPKKFKDKYGYEADRLTLQEAQAKIISPNQDGHRGVVSSVVESRGIHRGGEQQFLAGGNSTSTTTSRGTSGRDPAQGVELGRSERRSGGERISGTSAGVSKDSILTTTPHSDDIGRGERGDKRTGVTYDDAGNVIPLSQRFNPQNNDIRFMSEEMMDAIANGVPPTADEDVRLYGFTNDEMNAARKAAGLEPSKHVKKSDETLMQQAQSLLSNRAYMSKLARAVSQKARPTRDYENVALGIYADMMHNVLNEAKAGYDDLKASIAELPEDTDKETKEELKKQLKELELELRKAKSDFSAATSAKIGGASEQGRALRSNRIVVNAIDYSYAGLRGQIIEALGGEAHYTPEMDAEVGKLAEYFKGLDDDLRNIAIERLKLFSQKIVNDLKKNGDRISRMSGRAAGNELKRVMKNYNDALNQIEVHADEAGGTLIGLADQVQPMWGKWLKAIGEYHCYMNPNISEEGVILAIKEDLEKYLDDGIGEDDIRNILTGFGHNYRQSRYESQRKMNDLKAQSRLKLQKEYMLETGKLPPQTGMIRDEMSTDARALSKEVQQLKKDIDQQEGGANALKGALATAKTIVRNQIEDLERAILNNEKIERSKRSLVEDAELKELKAQRDELRKIYKEMFGENKPTDEQRRQALEKTLEKVLEKAVERLGRAKSGDFSVKKNEPITSDRIEELRASIKQTNEAVRALKKAAYPQGTPEEIARRNAVRMANRERNLARLQDKIANGDIRKDVKNPPPMPPEMQKQFDELGEQMKKGREQLAAMRLEAENATVPAFIRNAKEYGNFVMSAQRALRATMDASAVLRQAARLTLGHPVAATHAFGKAWNAMKSEDNLVAVNDEIMSDPTIQEAVDKFGLHLRKIDSTEGRDTEIFHGIESNYIKLFGKRVRITDIPFFGNLMLKSERHYITYLNAISAEMYTAIVNDKTRFPNGATPWQKKMIADMINIYNGSAALSKERRQAMSKAWLNNIFWAPQLAISRMQSVVMYDVINPLVSKGVKNADGTIDAVSAKERKTAAKIALVQRLKSTVAMIAIGSLIRWMLDDDDEEYNFKTADWFEKFLMVVSPKIGNTNIDLTGGESSFMRLLHTLAKQEKRSGTGRLMKFGEYGTPTAMSLIQRFAEGKSAPWLSTLAALYQGKDYIGNDYTLKTALKDTLVPLTFEDITEQVQQNGVGKSLLTIPLSLLGAGGGTYDRKPYENAANRFKEADKELRNIQSDETLDDSERAFRINEIESASKLMSPKVRFEVSGRLKTIDRMERKIKADEKLNAIRNDNNLAQSIEERKAIVATMKDEVLKLIRANR